jgi:hypothetical protein
VTGDIPVGCAGNEAMPHYCDNPSDHAPSDFTPEEFRIAVRVQGEALDKVATIGRKAILSGNPGVSAVGQEVLDVVEDLL